MKLSKRLMNVAEFVSEGLTVADVGTDHGFIPIYLVESGKNQHIIALDINKGPIQRAQAHIKEAGYENHIETRISDGLQKISPGEVESIIIAGMGGELIIRILDSGKEVLAQVQELVLSPHSEISLVRTYLLENDYQIIREKMLIDDGKYYTIIKAIHGRSKKYTDLQIKYGLQLIENKDETLKKYLLKEKSQKQQILANLQENITENTWIRKNQVQLELDLINQALGRY